MSTRPRRLASSLQQLNSVERTLLDLSFRRGVSDDVIGGLLKISSIEVRRRRDVALGRLAGDLGLEGERERAKLRALLAELPVRRWHPDGPSSGRRDRARSDRRRRWGITAAVVAAGVAAGALIGVTIAPGGGDPDSATARSEAAAAGPPVRFEPLGFAAEGTGSARLIGNGEGARLVVRVSGLPSLEEPYAIWLYDSVDRALLLERVVGDEFVVSERLPADPADYGFVDISREPHDGNPNHSGASVLRAPLAPLL